MSKGWHILRDGDSVTLCRQLPPRLEFGVQTVLPRVAPVRLAHQIRQDLWRALQNVRGFSPVIRLDPIPEGWAVTAGGRAPGPIPQAVFDRATAVLNSPANRARWTAHAGGTT
ncbi:hypothetical protein [uncultured Tateyamaria sp.]|uniref:hypothetical protein n=1 Tax=uncultured Tateyamaria sp. TaxID=455651 RepID=UPI0026260D38|nr:hypothetical protein [uncultured Tateyamaria sp.]